VFYITFIFIKWYVQYIIKFNLDMYFHKLFKMHLIKLLLDNGCNTFEAVQERRAIHKWNASDSYRMFESECKYFGISFLHNSRVNIAIQMLTLLFTFWYQFRSIFRCLYCYSHPFRYQFLIPCYLTSCRNKISF